MELTLLMLLNISISIFLSLLRPGGKYGVPEELTKDEVDQIVVRDELKRAAGVVASSLKVLH
jgi:hypothetical protein